MLNRYSEQTPFAQGFRAGSLLRAELAANKSVPVTIIPTGIWPLDRILNGGMRSGEITLIAAPTGHGKSALGEQIALEASKKFRTTFFALEMGRRRTETRLLGKVLHTDIHSVQNLMELEHDHPKLQAAFESLAYERMLIVEERDDSAAFTFDHVLAMICANEPKLVILDHPRHLDDWHGTAKTQAYASATNIVRRLVAAARDLNIHIVVVCQTKVQLQGKRPRKEDIADTYALAQAADAVVMIHRPFRGKEMADNVAELIVDKNRNGAEGMLHTRWHGPTMTYSELMPAEEARLECCKPRRVASPEDVEA